MADDSKSRTTINLDEQVRLKGLDGARRERRSFSNYIEVLIERDNDARLADEAKKESEVVA